MWNVRIWQIDNIVDLKFYSHLESKDVAQIL